MMEMKITKKKSNILYIGEVDLVKLLLSFFFCSFHCFLFTRNYECLGDSVNCRGDILDA